MRFLSAVAIASLAVAGSAAAQGTTTVNSACTGAGSALTGDTCQHGVDFFYYMTPQLGTAMAGGNTTLAQGGALGGMRFGFLPRIAIDARVNVVLGSSMPFSPNASIATQRTLTTTNAMIPMPAVDVALGVFKGIPLGVSNVGGVDILASALYVPEIKAKNPGDFFLKPKSSLSMGFGARVGLLQESLVAPGIGFSIIKRSLPVLDLGSSSGSFSFDVDDLDLSATSWRLTISKSLLLFGVAAGYGQDTYNASVAGISAANGGTSIGVPALKTEMKRSNMFADVSMNLFVLKIVATGGMVSGGDMATFYTLDTPADTKRTYGSVGVRFGF